MFSIFRDFLATRLIAQFDTLTPALSALMRNNTLVLPDSDGPPIDVALSTYANTLYAGSAGANVTLSDAATLLRVAGTGPVTVQTSNADSRVYGNDADNRFVGNDARDVFFGGTGADTMAGGGGNDVLYGGGGADTLTLSGGRDRAYGGAGDDIFQVSDGQGRIYGGAGADTYVLDASGDDLHIIFDFEARDQLIITGQGDLNSVADIVAAGGRVYESKGNTIIKLDDAQIQLRDFALNDLRDTMITTRIIPQTEPNIPPEPAPQTPPETGPDIDPNTGPDTGPDTGPAFGTVAAFLASGQANVLDEVAIGGTVYKLRDANPVHEDFKFTDAAGRYWSPDYFVVVAAGQSNMAGSGRGGDLSLGGNVAAYDWVNDAIIQAAYDAAPAGGGARLGSTIRNNLYFPMADQLAEDMGQPVLVIAHPVNGSRISTWLESGTGENWANLNPEVARALVHVQQDAVDAFIWHQGESDFPVPRDEYKALALELVNQVRDQDWAWDDLPFLFGELSRDGVNFVQNRALQELELENTDPNIGFVSSAGLISDELSGVHFNGENLNIFGGRYADVLDDILDGSVAAPNTAPTVNPNANTPLNITVTEGQELRLDMTNAFRDAEGDDLFYYAYLNKRNTYLARADQDTDQMIITPSFDHAGNYTLFIYANDYNLDGEALEINLTVTEANPLVTLYNNRAFDAVTVSARDMTTGLEMLPRNRGLEVLDQAAFAGDTNRILDVETAHIRGGADIAASFTLGADVRQSYFYGDASFDVVGNGINNYIVGADGGSDLSGAGGVDQLFGNGGNDRLYGGDGDDKLFGGDGDDQFFGGTGRDQATGGAGADRFVFADGDDQLFIRDFAADDILQITGFAGVNDYGDLMDAATLRNSGDRLVIDIADDRLMIDNFSIADLRADDFQFV